MSYSMSYAWYDVTCNVGICKSKWTLRNTSYHVRRMTGWALSYCGMRVAGCALYHKVILHCDVTPRYAVTSLRVALWRHSALRCDVTPHCAVTSLRVTLSRDFSPERHPAVRHIHVKKHLKEKNLFIKVQMEQFVTYLQQLPKIRFGCN
jgi:hypothetical protein